jgi:hypothetical protein
MNMGAACLPPSPDVNECVSSFSPCLLTHNALLHRVLFMKQSGKTEVELESILIHALKCHCVALRYSLGSLLTLLAGMLYSDVMRRVLN